HRAVLSFPTRRSSALAGAMLLLLRPPLSWFMVALVAGAEGLLRYYQGWSAEDVSFCVMATITVGLSMYALTRLSGFVRELHATRDRKSTRLNSSHVKI